MSSFPVGMQILYNIYILYSKCIQQASNKGKSIQHTVQRKRCAEESGLQGGDISMHGEIKYGGEGIRFPGGKNIVQEENEVSRGML